MSDPTELIDALDAAEDAFAHAHGEPTFEPHIDASSHADDGAVQIQKACRLLQAARVLQDRGEYYTSVLEHGFAVIERTLEGYLVCFTGADPADFHDHETAYRRAREQAPIEGATLETIEALYDARRTEHYYGTAVSTERQADELLRAASALHEYLVGFDTDLRRYCVCDET